MIDEPSIETSIEEPSLNIPSPTKQAKEDHSPSEPSDDLLACLPASENEPLSDSAAEKSKIEQLLKAAGVAAHSWKYAFSNEWSADEVAILIEKSGQQLNLNNRPGWIVKQLKDEQAHKDAQVDRETLQEPHLELEQLVTEYKHIERKNPLPDFDPVVVGWQKQSSVQDVWEVGVITSLELQFHKATINSWLRYSKVLGYERYPDSKLTPVLTIVAASQNAFEWLSQRMRGTVEGIARQHFGHLFLKIVAPTDIDRARTEIQRRIAEVPQMEALQEPPAPAELPAPANGNRHHKPDPATLSPEFIWDTIKLQLKLTDLTEKDYLANVARLEYLGCTKQSIYVKCAPHQLKALQSGRLQEKFEARVERVTGGKWTIRLVASVGELPMEDDQKAAGF